MTTTPSRKRPLLRILLVLVVLVVVLVALVPTIVSMTVGRGIVRDAIAASVDGDVDVGGVSLGWFSGQSITGISIVKGEESIRLDASIEEGLLALATSGGSSITAVLNGSIRTTLDENNQIGLAKLAKPGKGGDSATQPPAGTGTGAGGTGGGLPKGVKATLRLATLDVAVKDLARGKSYALSAIDGSAVVDGDAGTLVAKLASPTKFLDKDGRIALDATIRGLSPAANGGIDLGGIGLEVKVNGENIRVPAGEVVGDFGVLTLSINSPGLAQSLAFDANAQGTLDGATASTLTADLDVDKPVRSGAVFVMADSVRGTIEASNLPTALGQPFLAGAPIVLSEDVGPRIDVLRLRAPGGGTGPITLELKAKKAQIAATANVGTDGSIGGGTLEGSLTASPSLVERLANRTILSDAVVAFEGEGLAWAPAKDGASPLSTFVGSISIEPRAPIGYRDPQGFTAVLGPTGAIRLGRSQRGAPFVVDVASALALGGATPPAPPAATNVSLTAEVTEALDAIRAGRAEIDLALEPSFLGAVSKQSFSKPVPLKATVRSLAVPLRRTDGANPLAGLAIDAELRVPGESGLYVEQLARDVAFSNLALTVATTDASKETVLSIGGVVDRATIAAQQTLRTPPASFEGVDPLGLDLRGTVSVGGLDGAALVPWLPAQRRVLETAGIRDFGLDLRNEPLPGRPGQRLVADLRGEPLRGRFVGGVERTRASIETLDIAGALARDLVAALQSEESDKVVVAADAPFELALTRPVVLDFDALRELGLPAGLAGRLKVPSLVVSSAPGLASAVAVEDFDLVAELGARDGNAAASASPPMTAKGSFRARGTTGPNDRIEAATFDLAWLAPQGETLLRGLSGEIKLGGVSMPWVESLLGQERGRLSTWTGDDGGLAVTMGRSAEGETIRLVPTFPRVAGTVDVVARGESVVAKATDVAVRVPAASLEAMTVKPNMPPSATRYSFGGDLVAQLAAATVTLPKGLRSDAASGGSRIAGAAIDVALETQPLGVRVMKPGAAAERLDVPAILAKLTSKDLAQGISLTAKDRGTAPSAPGEARGGAPSIALDGTIRGLVSPDGAIATDAAVLDLTADVRNFPTVIVDLLGGTDGTLVRSLGDTLELNATAQNASAKGGRLSAMLKAPFAELSAPSVVVEDGIAIVAQDKPITASFELSPGIKDDILYLINPIFADIELAKRRATFAMPSLRYPLDKNFAKLDGDFTLDIGDVQLRNGAPFSTLLGFLKDRPMEGSEARIEPLAVTMRNGVVRYDNFGLKLFRAQAPNQPPGTLIWKTQLDMKGEIDLSKEPPTVVGITTSIPATQVGNFSSDVRRFFDSVGGPDSPIVRSLAIGLTMYGPLFDEKGNFKKLEQRVSLPTVEDIAKDPASLIGEGLKIFDSLRERDRKKDQPQQPK